MIYDCFIYNGEEDILRLRLEYYYNYVDYFVLVEAGYTFTNNKKRLYFKENKNAFANYLDKIIYLEIDEYPHSNSAWENEFFTRNFLKEGLINAKNEDVILISDVDEIINIRGKTHLKDIDCPTLISVPTFYYFLNLNLRGIDCDVIFATNYRHLKNLDIGNRKTYKLIAKKKITYQDFTFGGHFSYLWGLNIDAYINKLESFSHTEYNKKKFKDRKHILKYVRNGFDILRRYELKFKRVDIYNKFDKEFSETLSDLGLAEKYLLKDNLNFSEKLSDLPFISGYYIRKFTFLLWKKISAVYRKLMR